MDNHFFFEHPLTERMRLLLRYEFLWNQILFHLDQEHEFSYRSGISLLVEIIELIERGDIKNEVIKELDTKSIILSHILKYPDTDVEQTNELLNKIRALKDELNDIDNNFVATLKSSQLLNNIRHRISAPGGLLSFDLPEFHNWLRFPQDKKTRRLSKWLSNLQVLADAVIFILWLNREWIELEPVYADDGVYNHQLNQNSNVSLVRIGLDKNNLYFPEISAGRHRIIIRFCSTNDEDKPIQIDQELEFLIGMI